MWEVNGENLSMAEGDYGIRLPSEIKGTTFGNADEIKFVLKNSLNGETLIEKDYGEIVDNTFYLELTESESAKLPVGVYVYSLDWYQSGNFMCNVIPMAIFRVVDKVADTA